MPRGEPLSSAERQRLYQERYRRMRDALEAIRLAKSLKEAKALAEAALAN